MATLPVYNKTGSEVGKYEIDADQIASKISKQLLHDAVVMYQANQRQGSQHTKSRADVKGSTKKMYRQKGTGNARAGSRRSNVRRGGGHAFAIRNRDHSYRLPRKALRTATRMAFAGKLNSDQVIVLDELAMDAPKTSEIAAVLNALELNGTAIIVTDKPESAVHKSARNIPGVSVIPACDLNAYAILRPQKLVATKAAMDWVKENLKETKNSEAAAAS